MKFSAVSSLLLLAALTLITACDPQGTGQQKDNTNRVEPDKDENGVTTTKYDPNSSEPQTFLASGSSDIQSASITILPGSLGIDTEVSIEEGVSITDSDIGTSLGLDNTTFTTGGPAVAVTSSLLIDTTLPFTIALPIAPTAGLSLADPDNIVIVYKVTKAADAGGVSLGVFPTSSIRLEGGLAKVETNWFGVYQVAYADKPIITRFETRTGSPIVVKSKSTILTGNWKSGCNGYNDDSTDTATDGTQNSERDIQLFSFSHNRLNFTMKNFRDENCQNAFLKLEMGGVYQLGGPTPVHPEGKNLDVKIDSFILTLLSPENTAEANKNKFCGISDWVINKARSITEFKACNFGGDENQQDEKSCPNAPPENGKSIYTVILVEGNTLKTGQDNFPNCGRTPETRNSVFSDKARDILTKH